MKFLIKYYRQFSILLISFLFFNVIGACLNFILEESKNITINSYLTLGLLCVLAVEIFLGYVISKFVNKKLYAFILFIYIGYLIFSYLSRSALKIRENALNRRKKEGGVSGAGQTSSP